jgi:perosamine synthetase
MNELLNALAINGGVPVRETAFPRRAPFDEDDLREVTEALQSQDLFYSTGAKIAAFEKQFAEKYGVKHAIACSSGTAALHMAVAALDSDPGGEVIVPPVTDFGTIAGLLFQGLIPVFADWKENTFNMDPAEIVRKITDRTRAIVAVHLFGNPCDMDAISAIASERKIPIIEDCCQAYCTPYKGSWVGARGVVGCFSMQQTKHLPAGEGGVVITNSDDLAMRLSLFRDKGWENRGKWGPRSYTFLGLNYRMNELTGAVALAQLRKVENVVRVMTTLGNALTELIRDVNGITPAPVAEGAEHSYWLYPFKITGHDPEQFVKALGAEGIPVSYGYTGRPIYLCTGALTNKKTFGNSSYPFDKHYHPGNVEYTEGLCPVAEKELTELATLRIYENWSMDDIHDVSAAIHKVAAGL